MSKHLFADITKTEKLDDGTIKVWGYASTGAVDSDGETITPEAMKAAIPAYMEFGAVREMHKSDAAGTAIEATVGDDGRTWFGAHVVDPIAVKKVQTGVYKGFSIGGRVPKGGRDPLNKAIIKQIELIEVSLVDRPANPEAKITVFKNEKLDVAEDLDEIAALVDSGEVTLKDLIALAKAAKGTSPSASEPPPATQVPGESGETKDEVKKGMYGVSRFASVLQDVAILAQDTAFEAGYEGDGSPIPGQLQKWLKSGVEIFKGMTEEECSEMCAQLGVAVATLKANKPDLFKIADPIPAAQAGDVLTDAVAKHVAKAIAEAIDPVQKALETVTKEKDGLAARVEALSKQPAPGKAILHAVTKSADAAQVEDSSTINKADEAPTPGTMERAQWEMKQIFKGTSLVPNSPWAAPRGITG